MTTTRAAALPMAPRYAPAWVALGGFLGTLARLGVHELTVPASSAAWHPDVALVNVVGAFFLGLILNAPVPQRFPAFRVALGTGFCGAFTTFSAILVGFVDGTSIGLALLTAVVSVIGGIAGALVGQRARIGPSRPVGEDL